MKALLNNYQHRFVEYVINEIKCGIYSNCDRLKSEREWSESLGISRTTVRAGLQMLTEMGVIVRHGHKTTITLDALQIIENRNLHSAVGAVAVLSTNDLDNPIFQAIFQTVANAPQLPIKFVVDFSDRYPETTYPDLQKADIILIFGERKDAHLRQLARLGVPLLLVNFVRDGYHYVVPDNYAGGRLMAQSVYAAGHRRIAGAFFGAEDNREFYERYLGARDFLAEHGIELTPYLPIKRNRGEDLVDFYQRAFLHSWKPEAGNSAILAQCDGVALAIYELLKHWDLRIPEDVSVVGFDDQIYSEYSSPPLTTLRYPLEMIGHTVLDMIPGILANPTQIQQYRITPKLFQRSSLRSGGADQTF